MLLMKELRYAIEEYERNYKSKDEGEQYSFLAFLIQMLKTTSTKLENEKKKAFGKVLELIRESDGFKKHK